MRRRALFLVNPFARQGQADVAAIRSRLVEAGVELVDGLALNQKNSSQIIRELADRVDEVIIGGGDGTLNAAAAGLLETQKPFGILPMGTANDLCRTLAIPLDLTAACEVICAGQSRRIDLGQVNDRYFFNVASLGLPVKVTRRLSRESKSRWGVFAYIWAVAGTLIRTRRIPIELRAGGEWMKLRTVQLTVGNGRHYGGGMTVDQDSCIDDGLLELFSLEVRRGWQIIGLLFAMRRGTLGTASKARLLRGPVFEVRTISRRARSITTDGEITTRTPALFKVIPAALSVFVPSSPAEPPP